MATDRDRGEAKCPRCQGWAVELDHYPMKTCSTCAGTGKRSKVWGSVL